MGWGQWEKKRNRHVSGVGVLGGDGCFSQRLKRVDEEQPFRVNQEFSWGHIKSKMHIRNASGISYYVVLFRNLRLRREVRAGYLNLQVIAMLFFKTEEKKILKLS